MRVRLYIAGALLDSTAREEDVRIAPSAVYISLYALILIPRRLYYAGRA
jgi:hypothetical protein